MENNNGNNNNNNDENNEEIMIELNEFEYEDDKVGTRLTLPSEDEEVWNYVKEILERPINELSDIDKILTKFSEKDAEPRICTFFEKYATGNSSETGEFDFQYFKEKGIVMMFEVALQMPELFNEIEIPIFKMRSSWPKEAKVFGKRSFSLSRRQCACLLAHSFFGSLKRPQDVQKNDFRFTVVDLFMGAAVSPNSACIFLNYFNMIAKYGFLDEMDDNENAHGLIFIRQGYKKGPSPWNWDDNDKPLCKVQLVDGSIEENFKCDSHAEFANGFVGGGVMTGDAAMEEILFLVKPELMVSMVLENRMVDEESIIVSGAIKYSQTTGYQSTLEFDGEYKNLHKYFEMNDNNSLNIPTRTCAIDAIRGGGPAMTKSALLRDMNKARIAFQGCTNLATGHWGCGAFGNNHDLMFIKQWLAASDAGVKCMYYHDFKRGAQSHSIFPLIRKLKNLTVGQLWNFLLELTSDLQPFNVSEFSQKIMKVSHGKIKPTIN
eukprot:TRINITY_DN6249_c0_g1_i1.p1 TRINITY_DN6249_c0_g1~~TRINITY_DN6249_c0_g1_i1.p1  ORF type:complete len:491 (-),score=171.65 TRINITY_DN6249_c0_g1_i1:215-1687(-)